MAIINDRLPMYINDLINARKEARVKQKQLADMVRCENTHLSKIERGKAIPSTKLLGELCDELGLEIRLIKRK